MSVTAPPPPAPLPHAVAAEDLLTRFGTDRQAGLSSEEARRRLEEHGSNRLQESGGRAWWWGLLAQFNELVIWILIAAAVLAGIFGDWTDTIAILAIVILNAGLGFLQEERAERALEALKELSTPAARVVRDGNIVSLDSQDVVPGDIVRLEAGDFVPADGRLLESYSLSIQESALTGESVPVEKGGNDALPEETVLADRENMAYLATMVTNGRAVMLVTATGMSTELGQIASLLTQTKREPTPLQKRLQQLGKALIVACLAIVSVIFVIQILRGDPVVDVLLLAIGLAVAAVPEGLPAVVTVTLAIGLQRMARRNALIRKLHSVETLGSVTVICTDKTGTLTRNEMTVRELIAEDRHYRVTGAGYVPRGEFHPAEDGLSGCVNGPVSQADSEQLNWVLTIGARCNTARVVPREGATEAWDVIGDPTEGALVVAARKRGIDDLSHFSELYEIPFDSDRKVMSVVVAREDGSRVLLAKGAPEMLLTRCVSERRGGRDVALTEERRVLWSQRNHQLAQRALRVLALAFRADPAEEDDGRQEQDLVFCGLVGMIDPPREEVAEAVARCRQAGIRPVMITGDHPATAQAIARELGIATPEFPEALIGQDLERLSQEDLTGRVERCAVYARVTAAQKLRIVQAWQSLGQIVAMTGDGVNDAPAIQSADIGVAMGRTGTDVTRNASDMVLLDDNFTSIVNAVEEGRGIFDNIQKFVHFLLSCNAGEVMLMFLAALIGWPPPLQAIQLLWINLITDGLPALALAMEPPERDIMQRPPRPPSQAVITAWGGLRILTHGMLVGLAGALAFALVYRGSAENLPRAQSIAFCTMALSQLAYVFSCRSQTRTLPQLGLFSNPLLFLAVAVSVGLQLVVMLLPAVQHVFGAVPHPLADWWIAVGTSLLPVSVIELSKLVRFGFSGQRQYAT